LESPIGLSRKCIQTIRGEGGLFWQWGEENVEVEECQKRGCLVFYQNFLRPYWEGGRSSEEGECVREDNSKGGNTALAGGILRKILGDQQPCGAEGTTSECSYLKKGGVSRRREGKRVNT